MDVGYSSSNDNVRQSLTMSSTVCWSWPRSHIGVPLVHHLCIRSPHRSCYDTVGDGPLASKEVKPGMVDAWVRDKIVLSGVW